MAGEYPHDTGLQMTFDTLTDRGFDATEVKRRLDEYTGDVWMDFFGPVLDEIERALFTSEEITAVYR